MENLEIVPDRVSCFVHTLQLCVKDGLKASTQLTLTINKVAQIVNHIKNSTSATEKLEQHFGKTLISKNDTRWNSQLKIVWRLLEAELDEVIEKGELRLNGHEKNLLREFVEIFEPFEEATDTNTSQLA